MVEKLIYSVSGWDKEGNLLSPCYASTSKKAKAKFKKKHGVKIDETSLPVKHLRGEPGKVF